MSETKTDPRSPPKDPGRADERPAATSPPPGGRAEVPSSTASNLVVQIGRLGDLLVAAGKITAEQLEEALGRQKETRQRLGQLLVELGYVQEKDVIEVLGQQLGLPHVWLRRGLIDPKVVPLLPREKAELYKVIAMFRVGDDLTVAMSDPQSLFVIDQLASVTGCRVQPVVCRREEIENFIREYYDTSVGMDEFITSLDESDVELVEAGAGSSLAELEEMAEGSPIINLVNMIVLNAIKEGASDVHIEPDRKKMRVRYRVDGMMREVMTNRMDLHPAVISRLKVMASLDIGVRRRPQEGRIHVVAEGREVDLRVSSLPTVLGEKMVLRILDQSTSIVSLSTLGFKGDVLTRFRHMLTMPYGLILVTGPTGSGKTTTLYSAINVISSEQKNIITIEDPVEYQLDLINQVQVDERNNLSFANILRYVLRQDPDIILVGEIRDRETAEIAVQAALTGHLVISTLHTNDSAGAVTRLVEMGVEPFLIASSVIGALAQRLVRVICKECKTTFVPTDSYLSQAQWTGPKPRALHRGKGCKTCFDSGYKGRSGLYELLPVNEDVRTMILKNPTIDELRAERDKSGLPNLRQAGLQLVEDGTTTIEEVMRAICVEAASDTEIAKQVEEMEEAASEQVSR